MAQTTSGSQSGGAFGSLGGCLWNLIAIGLLIFFVLNFGGPIASMFFTNLYGPPQLVNSLRSTVMTEEWPLVLCVPAPQPATENIAALEAPQSIEAPSPRANALANLRGGPALDFFVVRVVREGEPLHVIAYTESEANGERWYLLRNGEWILGRLVDNPPANLPFVTLPEVNTEQEEARWNGLT